MQLSDYEHLYKGASYVDGKLVLRKLSDMTFEESDELKKVECKFHNTPYKPISDWAYKIDWLLSKHFDLFNLIGEGLAIDKTTLK